MKTSTRTLLCAAALVTIAACASRTDAPPSAPAPAPAPATQPAAKPAPAAQSQSATKPAPDAAKAATPYTGKVLVLGSALPPGVDHDVLGRIEVFQRSYGGVGDSYRLLGDKGREVGANAILDARVWLAPAVPIAAAPHGAGVAVRVRSQARLDEISKTGGRWE